VTDDHEAFLARMAGWRARAKRLRAPGVPRGRVVPERKILSLAVRRCHVPGSTSYENYGARGIAVCNLWRAPGGFAEFYRHVGPRPTPAHTLDRIDNNRGYEPGNVRWATRRDQRLNSRSAHFIEANGERLCVDDWAKRLGCGHSTIVSRIRSGWDPGRAVTTPVRQGRYNAARRVRELARTADLPSHDSGARS
jgi:hypothetical protein